MSKFDTVKSVVTSKAARQILLTKKHSPKILFAAGVVGVVGTVVMACRATLKTSELVGDAEMSKDLNKKKFNQGNISEEARLASDRKIQIALMLDIAKLYSLPTALGLLSIGALAGGQIILTKRNGMLMAAYATLDKAHKEYRARVAKDYGDDVDRRYATGVELINVEEKLADGTTAITTKEMVSGKFGGSPYAVVFDERSRKFSKAPRANAATIEMIQSFMDHKLKAMGHLFLNEVLDALDLPRTGIGAQVGWVYDMTDPNHKGDNYVDFGVFSSADKDLVEAFINGDYYYVTLDFNVDGIIIDKI